MGAAEIIMLGNFAIQFGIPAAMKIAEVFRKKDATVDDVKNAFALAQKDYESYERLPAGSNIAPLPPVGSPDGAVPTPEPTPPQA